LGWDPADPRLEKLAARMAAWAARNHPDTGQRPAEVPAVLTLMAADIASDSPAWSRLTELSHRPARSLTE